MSLMKQKHALVVLRQRFAKRSVLIIGTSQSLVVRSTEIVHHVAYVSGGVYGFRLLCDTSRVTVNSTYHARVVTEIDPADRTMTLTLTSDPVDCMKCLVRHGQRS